MQALLKEYVVSGVYAEAAGCLRALDAPHYHHEFVKRALLAAFETPEQAPALMSLLATLTETGQVSQVGISPRHFYVDCFPGSCEEEKGTSTGVFAVVACLLHRNSLVSHGQRTFCS